MKSYGPAIVVSLIGHGLLVFLAVWSWEFTHTKTEVKTPSYIKANLVELQPKVKPKVEIKKTPKAKPKPKPKPKKDDSKKRELEKKRQQELAEKKRREAEQKRKNQLAKKKADEQRKKEDERKAKEKKAAEKKRQQQELERQALAKALAAEKAQLEAEKQAAEDAVTVQSYVDLISARVEHNWSRPPSARNNMQVVLRIQLVPTGQVVAVDVLDSSGDDAFDRSAVRAVKKVERFPELKELPSRVFERQFRSLKFVFSPEDLRQ